jgi:hypothetical protein
MPTRWIACLLLALSAIPGAAPTQGGEAPARKVRMAFTSLSSVMCAPWIAREAGIFSKHGLDVEVIATRTGVEGVMGKYLRTANPAALAESYEIDVQKYMLRVPLTTVEAMKSVLDDLGARIPKAKDADPRKFFDDSFVRQLQSSGFIDALHR